jgi:hypothetical protein
MTRRRVTATGVLVALLALLTTVRADSVAAPAATDATPGFERHHYSITARVRPLLVFWISRSGVGDAVVTRRRAPAETRYSLLIGSDPDRAPRRINRWGYIEESIRGTEAHLVGLMTESDEDSVEQAEASLRTQAGGHHPFKVIQATVNAEQASSLVTSLVAPEDYTFRQLRTVLGLALRESSAGTSRVLRLPPGTRPGFLAALADAMHAPSASPIKYVYHGRLYELRRTRARTIPNLRIDRARYGPAIAADYIITSAHDGEQTPFSMTYGTEGRFAEVPLAVTYQPRWWMQVELTIDDSEDASSLTDGVDH